MSMFSTDGMELTPEGETHVGCTSAPIEGIEHRTTFCSKADQRQTSNITQGKRSLEAVVANNLCKRVTEAADIESTNYDVQEREITAENAGNQSLNSEKGSGTKKNRKSKNPRRVIIEDDRIPCSSNGLQKNPGGYCEYDFPSSDTETETDRTINYMYGKDSILLKYLTEPLPSKGTCNTQNLSDSKVLTNYRHKQTEVCSSKPGSGQQAEDFPAKGDNPPGQTLSTGMSTVRSEPDNGRQNTVTPSHFQDKGGNCDDVPVKRRRRRRRNSGSAVPGDPNAVKKVRVRPKQVCKKRPFACHMCRRSYAVQSSLDKHMTTHSSLVRNSCNICNESFPSFPELSKHKRTHKGEGSFSCNICHERFDYLSSLTKHRMTHPGQGNYSCKLCGKRFSRSGGLSTHMRTHNGERRFACMYCAQRFMHASSLGKHILLHTGEKPFVCEICDKRFRRADGLSNHLTLHTGRKPYVCEVCDRQFTVRDNLIKHRFTHTGERPYGCELCPKRFAHPSTLAKHTLTHTNEKPYACTLCNRLFNRISSLTRHAAIHVAEKMICRVCEVPFTLECVHAKHMVVRFGKSKVETDDTEEEFSVQESPDS